MTERGYSDVDVDRFVYSLEVDILCHFKHPLRL